ncbi:glycosyltransferase [Chryseobacterium sp. MDT2-18]|uniref:glycosyltransferase n=1 Tax=Chryseobacterium sp. MDT2-18 TaxID=1259136 RepID=UPI0027D85907|nr:glycosyltransferase [Chryseobacterium sp. MDT2-18]
MKDKTILYVGGFKLPDKNAAAHRVLANSMLFNKLGYRVTLIGHSDNLSSDNLKFEGEFGDSIEMFSRPYPNNFSSWIDYIISPKSIINFCKKYQPTHIIFYNYPSFAQLRLYFFLKKENIIWLSDTTEWYSASEGNIIKRIIKKLDTSLRLRIINKLNNGNIVISKYLQKFYNNKNTLLLPPLTDYKDNKWHNIPDQNSIDNQTLNLIYAGQFGTKKDNLVAVFDILNELIVENNFKIIFNIVGMTLEDYQKNINTKSYDFITFHGRKSHSDTINFIKRSDFVFFFRTNNRVNTAGFPTKFVEAHTCAIPVITNLSSDLSEYLKDGENGFVISNDTTILKVQLLKILSLSKDEILTIKEKLRENEIFDYRKYISVTESFFKKINK